MIRDILRDAWADSPTAVVLSIAVTPLALIAAWALLVFAIVVAGSPAGPTG